MGIPDDLSDLKGEALNAVSFVTDYLEFHFNGPVLRAFASPEVEVNGKRKRFPEDSSREALCALIGREDESVELRDGEEIRLRLQGNAMLMVPLGLDPESAHFQTADHGLYVW